MTDTTPNDRQRIAGLVSKATVAMLTTRTSEGRYVSRPMGLQEGDFDGDLWFFAYDSSAKVAQIHADSEVNVSFSDTKNHSWTSIAGRARIVHDRDKAEQLYSPALKAWFPDGLETPGLTLIKIEADTAEYWEGPTSAVAWLAGNLRAVVTKNPDNDPIRNDTVQL